MALLDYSSSTLRLLGTLSLDSFRVKHDSFFFLLTVNYDVDSGPKIVYTQQTEEKRRLPVKWNEKSFLEDLRRNSSREVAAIGETLCSFAERHADESSWGRGSEYGSLTFRAKSDFGMISLFQLTTKGLIKFPLNAMKQKGVPKPLIQNYRLKLESNFLKDFDEESYPSDSFEDMGELFNTSAQVTKFTQCIEGIAYRLRQ